VTVSTSSNLCTTPRRTGVQTPIHVPYAELSRSTGQLAQITASRTSNISARSLYSWLRKQEPRPHPEALTLQLVTERFSSPIVNHNFIGLHCHWKYSHANSNTLHARSACSKDPSCHFSTSRSALPCSSSTILANWQQRAYHASETVHILRRISQDPLHLLLLNQA